MTPRRESPSSTPRRQSGAAALLLLLAAAAASAQRLQVETYSMDDGLPSAEVVDLAQDASGRLWVLTAGGLTLYDGQTWTAPPRAGLPALELGAIEIDAAGRPSVVTRLNGPLVYRLEGAAWQALPAPEARTPHDFSVTSFLVGADDAPRVAVGSASSGLWLWDGERWWQLRAPLGLPSDLVVAVADFDGRIAVATGEGLCFLDDGGPDCSIRGQAPWPSASPASACCSSASTACAPAPFAAATSSSRR
jgi:hypothetical protein